MRAILRPLDGEFGHGDVGGQGAGSAEAGDAPVDQGADLGFHEGGNRLVAGYSSVSRAGRLLVAGSRL